MLIGPSEVGIIGCLGYGLLSLLIFLSPRALAPVDTTFSTSSTARVQDADQAKLGATL